jgi:Protein of unknown function (DUF3644)
MISAIEIYNKPDFKYREETFAILAINSWELLLKARWLKENNNKLRSLYVVEKTKNKSGEIGKRQAIKLTSCNNPFTHGLDFLAEKLLEKKILHPLAKQNIDAVKEIRDTSVHFYNRNNLFAIRLQEVASGCVKNFAQATKTWFKYDLSKYNFYLLPLAFVNSKTNMSLIELNKEEANLVKYIALLDAANDPASDYSVSVNVEVNFSKSKVQDALNVQYSNDPSAPKVYLSQEQFKNKWPMNYEKLTEICGARYIDFKRNNKYHDLRKSLLDNPKYAITRKLDEDNPRSIKQNWFGEAVFTELDKHYLRK